MPHKGSRCKFKVPFLFNCCFDDQFRSASFDLHWLKLWILFTGQTSMAYNKWEWKIDYWMIQSTQHSLPSLQWPSTIVCLPGKQASLGSHQWLVHEVEHNVSVIRDTLITRLIIHAQMYFVVRRRFLFFLARGSIENDRQYPQHDPQKDPLNWYGLGNGKTSQSSEQLWWELHWLHPRGADRETRQFF